MLYNDGRKIHVLHMNQWRKSHMTLNDYMDKGREEGLEEGRREESERYDKLIEFSCSRQ